MRMKKRLELSALVCVTIACVTIACVTIACSPLKALAQVDSTAASGGFRPGENSPIVESSRTGESSTVTQTGAVTLRPLSPQYKLTPRAREAAEILGLSQRVERLLQLKGQRTDSSANISDEEMALKLGILDKVLGASLEVRMVAGRIDRELGWAYNGHDMLQAKRQRNLNMIFTANFLQLGVLGTLSGPLFLTGQSKAGGELLLIADSVGLALTALATAESRSGKKKIDGGTTILAEVFHLDSNDKPDHRIEVVTAYLNAIPPDSKDKKTRIEALVAGWKKGKYLTSESTDNLQKLSGINPTGQSKEDIGLLTKRIRMLFDTQYTVEMLHEGLLELLRAVQ